MIRHAGAMTSVRVLDAPAVPIQSSPGYREFAEHIYPHLLEIRAPADMLLSLRTLLNPNKLVSIVVKQSLGPRKRSLNPLVADPFNTDADADNEQNLPFLQFLQANKFPKLQELDISGLARDAYPLMKNFGSNFPSLVYLSIPSFSARRLAFGMNPAQPPDPTASEINIIAKEFIAARPIRKLNILSRTRVRDIHCINISDVQWPTAHLLLPESIGLSCLQISVQGNGRVWDLVPLTLFQLNPMLYDALFDACFPTDIERIEAVHRRASGIKMDPKIAEWAVAQLDPLLERFVADAELAVAKAGSLLQTLSSLASQLARGLKRNKLLVQQTPKSPLSPDFAAPNSPTTIELDEELDMLQAPVPSDEQREKLSRLFAVVQGYCSTLLDKVPLKQLLKLFEGADSIFLPPQLFPTLSAFDREWRDKYGVSLHFAEHHLLHSFLSLIPATLLGEISAQPAFAKNAEAVRRAADRGELVRALRQGFFALLSAQDAACDTILDLLSKLAPEGLPSRTQPNAATLSFLLSSPARAAKYGRTFSDTYQLIFRPTTGLFLWNSGCTILQFKAVLEAYLDRFEGCGWEAEDEVRLADMIFIRTIVRATETVGDATAHPLKWALDYFKTLPRRFMSILLSNSDIIFAASALDSSRETLLQLLPDGKQRDMIKEAQGSFSADLEGHIYHAKDGSPVGNRNARKL